jgi:hypothetical protein
MVGGASSVAEMPQRHRAALRQREMILLAVLVNNPDAVDIVAERLGFVAFSDPGLDSLRQAIVNAIGSEPGLDSARLESHLRSLGHSNTLDLIMGASTFEHAFFSRRGTALTTAIEGWEETYAFYMRERMRDEIDAEKRDLARCIEGECRRSTARPGGTQSGSGATAQRYEYFEALKIQEQNQEYRPDERANEGCPQEPLNPGTNGKG